MSFKAFRIHQQEKGVRAGVEQMEVSGLTEGDVVVRGAYSGINFKDALAEASRGDGGERRKRAGLYEYASPQGLRSAPAARARARPRAAARLAAAAR